MLILPMFVLVFYIAGVEDSMKKGVGGYTDEWLNPAIIIYSILLLMMLGRFVLKFLMAKTAKMGDYLLHIVLLPALFFVRGILIDGTIFDKFLEIIDIAINVNF